MSDGRFDVGHGIDGMVTLVVHAEGATMHIRLSPAMAKRMAELLVSNANDAEKTRKFAT